MENLEILCATFFSVSECFDVGEDICCSQVGQETPLRVMCNDVGKLCSIRTRWKLGLSLFQTSALNLTSQILKSRGTYIKATV